MNAAPDVLARGLAAAVRSAQNGKGPVVVQPYAGDGAADGYQFVLLLKPELTTAPDAHVEDVMGVCLAVLAGHDVRCGAMTVFPRADVVRHKLVERQYTMLHSVARHGMAAVPQSVFPRLDHAFPDIGQSRVVGGYKLLARLPDLSPAHLEGLARDAGIVKLGSGCYASRITVQGEEWLVLNAFHPWQFDHLTSAPLVAIECHAHHQPAFVRSAVVGTIDPAEAADGSVRRVLHQECHRLGLGSITTRTNGAHVPPGPLESMFAVQRLFGEDRRPLPLTETTLGRLLCGEGCSPESLQSLEGNPEVRSPTGRAPLFELNEDMSCQATGALVAAARLGAERAS